MFEGYSEKGTGSEERGPSSFTFQPPGAVQSNGDQAVGYQGGIRGGVVGNTARTVQLDNRANDQTLQQIMKFGQEIIQPHLQRAKDEAFLRGAQRAATGEALTEIVNEQPWYSKIFGDTPLVEGARAFEVQRRVTSWSTEQEAAMPKLREQSPDSIPQYLMSTLDKFKTGDADTDGMIKMQMMSVVPQLIKQHTRENYQYLQERISTEKLALMGAAGLAVQMGYAAGDKLTPEEKQQREYTLLDAFAPVAGENLKAHAERFVGSAKTLAEDGNWHAYNVLEKSGALAQLPPAKRLEVQRAARIFSHQQASESVGDYLQQIAILKAKVDRGDIAPANVAPAYAELNAEFQKNTGNPAKIVADTQVLNETVNAASVLARMELSNSQRIGKAAATEEEAIVQDAEWKTQFAQGNASQQTGGAKVDASFTSWVGPLGADTRPGVLEGQVQKLVMNKRYTNPDIKDGLTKLVLSARDDITPNFMQGYAVFKTLGQQGGAEAQQRYFDSTQYDLLRDFAFRMNGSIDPAQAEQAFELARTQPTLGKKPDTKAAAAIVGATKDLNSWWPTALGGRPDLNAASQRLVVSVAGGYYTDPASGDTATPAKMALERARTQGGLQIFEGSPYAYVQDPDRDTLSMTFRKLAGPTGTAVPDSHIGAAIEQTVKAKLDTVLVGETPIDSAMYRITDGESGEQRFLVYARTDSANTPVVVTSTDFYNTYRDKLSKFKDARLPEKIDTLKAAEARDRARQGMAALPYK